MILPNKNISLSNSLLGIGSVILKELSTPQTISSLWEKSKKHEVINSYEKFVLSLDLLFLLGSVNINQGIIKRNTKHD